MAALDALNRREVAIPWEELEPLLQERLLRRVALSALGRTGRVEALGPLFAALEESTLHVVAAASVALARLIREGGELAEARSRACSDSPSAHGHGCVVYCLRVPMLKHDVRRRAPGTSTGCRGPGGRRRLSCTGGTLRADRRGTTSLGCAVGGASAPASATLRKPTRTRAGPGARGRSGVAR